MLNNALMQVYHTEEKVEPFTLKSLINKWKMAGCGAVSTSDAKGEETDLLANFLSGVSDELCSQLHSGIMKTARRVLLDEIVSNIILDFIARKKAHKLSKPESICQSAEIFSSNGVMVMRFPLRDSHFLFLFKCTSLCFIFVDSLKVQIAGRIELFAAIKMKYLIAENRSLLIRLQEGLQCA